MICSGAKRCSYNIRTKPCRLKLAFLFSVCLDFHVFFNAHVIDLKIFGMEFLVEVLLEEILIYCEVIIGMFPF